MATTGLDTFDSTIQDTNLWLKAVMERLGTEDRHVGYAVLKAVLHAIRDRVGPGNAVQLGAQLPTLLRGAYYEGWRMAETPTRERRREAFLEHVRAGLSRDRGVDIEQATRAVIEVLWDRIDRGEAAKLVQRMPVELRSLWSGVPPHSYQH